MESLVKPIKALEGQYQIFQCTPNPRFSDAGRSVALFMFFYEAVYNHPQ